MYKKGAGNGKQGKDAGNRTLCPYRIFSQAINARSEHLVPIYTTQRIRIYPGKLKFILVKISSDAGQRKPNSIHVSYC